MRIFGRWNWYYVCYGIIAVGVILTLTSLIGTWAKNGGWG